MSMNARTHVICQVVPALQSGGVERGTVDIAQALVAKGYKALVISAGGRLVEALENTGAEHITLPMTSKNPYRMLLNVFALKRLIRERGISLIHMRSRAPAWSCLWAAAWTSTPLVTTYHGTYNAKNCWKRLYNSVMARGDVVIAPSAFIQAHLLKEHRGVIKGPLKVIHRGVDLEAFSPDRVSSETVLALKTRWGVSPDEAVLLLPGRLTRWKGQGVFLHALATLRKRVPERRFVAVIIGEIGKNQAYYEELCRLTESLGLVQFVRILDHSSSMAEAYAAADLVISASLDPEAFGRVMAEAHAMERLVVATNHGGAKEIILPQQTGWLVTPGNADELAAALDQAIALPIDERARRQKVAREHVRAHFSLEQMQEKTLEVYENLLRGVTVC